MQPLETFLWGAFGGFGAEVGTIFALRRQLQAPYPLWLKSPVYYLLCLVMIAAGGVVAVAYARSGTTLNAILAIQIGASAPLILRKLSETVFEPAKAPDPSKIN